jgi:HEAT repeat protein
MQASKTVNGVRINKAKRSKAKKKKAGEKSISEQLGKGISEGISQGIEAFASSAKKVGDVVCSLPKSSVDFIAKKTPEVGGKAKGLVVKGVSKINPVYMVKDVGTALGIGEKASLKSKRKELRKKIKSLQFEIGRERSDHSLDIDDENEKIRELIAKIKIYEGEVGRLKQCIEKIDRKEEDVKGRKVEMLSPEKQLKLVKKNLDSMIRKILRKKDAFESVGQKCVFSNAVKGLIEDDIEARIMAVSELGRIGHREAVPLLTEAFSYGNAYLDSEIASALININEPSVIPILKEKMKDTNYRVRLKCLRGMYKLGGKEVINDLLLSINDDHASVRRTAATCLGWCGDKKAVSALIEVLKDKKIEVRKAAILALGEIRDIKAVIPLIDTIADSGKDLREKIKYSLSKITGQDIPFNTDLSGEKNQQAVIRLKIWWKRVSNK